MIKLKRNSTVKIIIAIPIITLPVEGEQLIEYRIAILMSSVTPCHLSTGSQEGHLALEDLAHMLLQLLKCLGGEQKGM